MGKQKPANPNISLLGKREARSENQEIYLDSIDDNPITVCIGQAGTGKTSLAVYKACEYLAHGRIQKIILTRPMVNAGSGLGFLPGDVTEKYSPYLVPLLVEAEVFLGPAAVRQLISERVIELVPLELIRGRNLHNSFCIASEMQNADYDQILAFVSRIGKQSKMVIEGDPKQTDLGSHSGLLHVRDALRHCRYTGCVELGPEDIQRSPILREVLGLLEQYKNEELLYVENLH